MKNTRMTSSTLMPQKLSQLGRKLTTHLATGALAMAMLVSSDMVFAQDPAANPSPSLNEANLNFVGADIESVIKAIGHYTSTTFIIDPRVKGTINLVTEKPVTKEQAFSLLTSTLRLQGYAVVKANGFAKVVPESDGKLQAGPTQVAGVKGDQIATQVFDLNYENAGNLVTVLRPLISPNNTISADQSNNAVVITDYADNLKRLAKIIATLDVPSTTEVDVIPLKHAIAVDVATLVMRLTEQQAIGPSEVGKTVVLAESRTNAILLHAPSEARANLVKTLIAKLDQPTALPGNVHVVYLRNADAVKLAQTLRAIVSPESASGTTGTGTSGYGSSQSSSYQNRPSSSSSGFGGSSGMGSSSSSGMGFGGGSGGGMGMGSMGGGGSSFGGGGGQQQNTLPAGGPAGFIQADSATNTLIITASEPVYRNLRAVIDQLDARRAQVYIEALIIDVTTSNLEQFGVQWAGVTGNANSKIRVGGATSFTNEKNFNLFQLAAQKSTAIPSTGFNLAVLSSQLGLGAIASALQTSGMANVLSVPTLTTLDNEEANVLVGKNVPFVTGQYTNSAPSNNSGTVNPFQTVERKDVGVILKVRPQISEGGAVKMVIYQEVSDIDDKTNAAGVITNKRALETNVIVDDGEILVLGGLISDTSASTMEQVPLLGDIPVIGNLFKYRKKDGGKRNLLVFLRPTVMRNLDQSTAISVNRYDYIRAAAKADSEKPLLNVPSLAPEMQGILVPQNIVNRGSNKLDAPTATPNSEPAPVNAEPAPAQSPDAVTVPVQMPAPTQQ
jgi:general secretion pathway protein D